MLVYHGTSAANGRRILREGIKPRRVMRGRNMLLTPGNFEGASHADAVYLAFYWAPMYAIVAAAQQQDNLCLVEIDLARLDEEKLMPDEDFLEIIGGHVFDQDEIKPTHEEIRSMAMSAMTTHRGLWRQSLEDWSACAYQGIVPSCAVKRVVFVDCKQMEPYRVFAVKQARKFLDTEEPLKKVVPHNLAFWRSVTRAFFQTRSDTSFDLPFVWVRAVDGFSLDLQSIHGPNHWIVVELGAEFLARDTGADLDVLRLFSVLHDACRCDDGDDPLHGHRAAELAAQWRGELFQLDDARFSLLDQALRFHADGQTSEDPTIGTCWDADRLDLPRVGMPVDSAYLSTEAARRAVLQS